jgi:hypothetical protein
VCVEFDIHDMPLSGGPGLFVPTTACLVPKNGEHASALKLKGIIESGNRLGPPAIINPPEIGDLFHPLQFLPVCYTGGFVINDNDFYGFRIERR